MWLLVMLLVALWVSVVWLNLVNHRNTLFNLRQQSEVQALALAEHVEATLKLADYAVLDLRDEWLTGPNSFADALVRHHALLTNLKSHTTVLDARGLVVFSNRPGETIGTPAHDRPYFNAHQTGGTDVLRVDSHLLVGQHTGSTLAISRPLQTNGQFAGVLVLSLDPAYFIRFFQSMDMGQDGLLSLVANSGELLARSKDQDTTVGTMLRGVPFVAPGAAPRGHYDRVSSIDGILRSTYYVTLPAYGLTVTAALSFDEHLAPLLPRRYGFIALSLAATLLMSLAARRALAGIERREQADRLLQETKNNYEALVNSLPLGVVVHQAGKVVYINPAAIQLIGAPSAADVLGTPVLRWVHPDHHTTVVARVKHTLASGSTMPPQQEVFLKWDGSPFDVDTQGAATLFAGAPAIQVSFQDITERKHMLAALQASESKWRTIIANSVYGISIFGLDGSLQTSSLGALQMFGYATEADTLGKTLTDFVDAADLPKLEQVLDELMHGKRVGLVEARAIRADGTRFWADSQADLLRNAQGEPTHFIFMTRDVTQRRHDEDELKLAASVFSHAREGIMITDARGTIVAVNETFTHITGYAEAEVLGRLPSMLSSGRQSAVFYADMWRTIQEKGHWSGEIWNRRKGGEVFAEMLTISAVRSEAGDVQHYVSLFTDITPMKQHQRQLEHIAHYDALTNLPNRVLLADRLQQALAQGLRRGKSVAVVYLDLDGFKDINDTHGHATGDELLILLAQRMKTALREGDSLARFGGDEFVAVLVDLDHPQDCEPVLARLLRATADVVPLAVDSGMVMAQVSASIGVTVYPQDNADADLLLRHADQAMYLAKQGGKNRYHLFDVAQDVAVNSQRETVENVQKALAQGEFVLFYQPKVNALRGTVVGMEALIRWQHPERGLLAPGTFLPIIENHPVTLDVGDWVLQTAIAQMAQWHEQGLALPVSVNVGALQLQQPDFAAKLQTLLAAYPSLPTHCLELEVLETSALDDVPHVSDIMRACRFAGVRFALDDFGTGYSSLTYLKHLPAETIKIDQSFVRDMLVDEDDLAIITGVIGLTKAFGREVIAEGVETAAHAQRLLAMDCPQLQGYGIARPMPAAEVQGWVADWTAAHEPTLSEHQSSHTTVST
ncbi:MAG: EAL domain-containing protein [Burkholderiales bacterium]|nr:EAL domain-containing protein [Burkholderiales bacterium]